MEVALLCFDRGVGASFFGSAVVELAGVVDGLAVVVDDLEDAAVGFFGAVVCLFAVEGALVFFGGSLGIFFFCSGMFAFNCFDGGMYLWLVTLQGSLPYFTLLYLLSGNALRVLCFPRKWHCGAAKRVTRLSK